MRKARGSIGLLIAALLLCGYFMPLQAQEWPHEATGFGGDLKGGAPKGDSLQSSSGRATSRPPQYEGAPSKAAWKGPDTTYRQDGEGGYYEFRAGGAVQAREVAPIKPTLPGQQEPSDIVVQSPKVVSTVPEPEARYRLHIGDRLMVSIYGELNTEREVIVDSAGQITYPIVGTMKVVGRTIDKVRKEMNERIQKIYRYTFVTITPIEFGGEYYTVLGSVSMPGKKLLLGRETVLSALCRSGGFPSGIFRNRTVDLADLDHSFLLRKGEYVPVDFRKLVVDGDVSADVALQPGDYIYIPSSLEKEIFVLGEVAIPSALGYINKVSLAEAIALAGGTTFNASSRAVVIRGSLKEPYAFYIDINLIFKGCEPDFLLKPGDIVYVPARRFTLLREIVQYAVRVFVSTAASNAGSNSWASITGTSVNDNVNVIPNSVQSGLVPPPVVFAP